MKQGTPGSGELLMDPDDGLSSAVKTNFRIKSPDMWRIGFSLRFKPPSAQGWWECQGYHGRCGADYRCCLPALAGFVSPHSMDPGGRN